MKVMHPINDNRIQHPIIETIKKPGFASELDCLKTGIDVLDIGCGNGSYWFDLFYELNFNSITGIDNKSKDEINISFGGRIAVNNYSDYKQYRQKQNTNIKQLTETEFNKIFKFHQIDLNKFLDSEIIVNSKYDVIIMSLFIYFFEKTTAIDYIKKLMTKLKPKGYFYVLTSSEYFGDPLFEEQRKIFKFKSTELELEEMLFPMKKIISGYQLTNNEYRDIIAKQNK